MKYSKKATIDFAKSINKEECLQEIGQLTIKEGCKDAGVFTGGEIIIDMDCVEHKSASKEKRQTVKSMDSAFLIEDINGVIREIVFVEYRFNYTNLTNLNRAALVEKVAGSTIAANSPSNLHDNYYFVFDSNIKNQAINRLARMNPAVPQQFKAVNIQDIHDTFFV